MQVSILLRRDRPRSQLQEKSLPSAVAKSIKRAQISKTPCLVHVQQKLPFLVTMEDDVSFVTLGRYYIIWHGALALMIRLGKLVSNRYAGIDHLFSVDAPAAMKILRSLLYKGD